MLCAHLHSAPPVVQEVVGLDVPVNDAKLMDVSERLQQVIDVQTDLGEAQGPDDFLTFG